MYKNRDIMNDNLITPNSESNPNHLQLEPEAFCKRAYRRMQLALDAGEFGDWNLDLNTGEIERSLKHDQFFGYNTLCSQWNYDILIGHIHPDDRERVHQTFRDAFTSQAPMAFQCRISRIDGSEHCIAVRGKAYYCETGQAKNIAGIISDATEFPSKSEMNSTADGKPQLPTKVGNSHRDLQDLFMQAPIPIAIIDGKTQTFTFTNSSYQRFVGQDPFGMPLSKVFTEAELSEFNTAITKVLHESQPYHSDECRRIRSNAKGSKSESYIKLIFHPINNTTNESPDVLAVIQDVTNQVLARKATEATKLAIENERANVRNLFQETPEFFCILSGPEHRFEFVNNTHIKVLGFDATGQAVRVVQPESVEVHGILDDVYRSGVTFQHREIPVTVGGSLRYFNLTFSSRRGFDGKINGVMILGAEVTDQVRAREATIKAKEAADAANIAKSNFVANMSHEIRTPIAIIQGFCEILQDESLSFEVRSDYVQRILSNTKSLSCIVDDILDLAKVEAGKLKIFKQEIAFVEFMEEIVNQFSDQIKEKNIYLNLSFENSAPRKIRSDQVRLRQILINVIGNAIKFTNSGGVRINVRSQINVNRERQVEIRVIDTGIGLTRAQADKLFQPFVQVDTSRSRQFGGTGLGLAISKRLALALNGDISIERPGPGQGSCFTLTLSDDLENLTEKQSKEIPQGKPWEADKTTNSSERVEPLAGLRILLAEDSRDIQLLMTTVLKKNGANIFVVENGSQAVEYALHNDCDIILMDIQMPHLNGLEATKRLRNDGLQKAHHCANSPCNARRAGTKQSSRLRRSSGQAYQYTKANPSN